MSSKSSLWEIRKQKKKQEFINYGMKPQGKNENYNKKIRVNSWECKTEVWDSDNKKEKRHKIIE